MRLEGVVDGYWVDIFDFVYEFGGMFFEVLFYIVGCCGLVEDWVGSNVSGKINCGEGKFLGRLNWN